MQFTGMEKTAGRADLLQEKGKLSTVLDMLSSRCLLDIKWRHQVDSWLSECEV